MNVHRDIRTTKTDALRRSLVAASLLLVAPGLESEPFESALEADPFYTAILSVIERAPAIERFRFDRRAAHAEAELQRIDSDVDIFLEARPGLIANASYERGYDEKEYTVRATSGLRTGIPGRGRIEIQVTPSIRFLESTHNDSQRSVAPEVRSGFQSGLSSSASVRFPVRPHTSESLRVGRRRYENAVRIASSEYNRKVGEFIEDFVEEWFGIVEKEIEMEHTGAVVGLQRQRVATVRELVDIGDRNLEELWDEENQLADAEIAHIAAIQHFRSRASLLESRFDTRYTRGYALFLRQMPAGFPGDLTFIPGVRQHEIRDAELVRRETRYAYLERNLDEAPEFFLSVEAEAGSSAGHDRLSDAIEASILETGDWSFTVATGISLSSLSFRRVHYERDAHDSRERALTAEISRLEDERRTTARNLSREIEDYLTILERRVRELESRDRILQNRRIDREAGIATSLEVWAVKRAKHEAAAAVDRIKARIRQALILYQIRYGERYDK